MSLVPVAGTVQRLHLSVGYSTWVWELCRTYENYCFQVAKT